MQRVLRLLASAGMLALLLLLPAAAASAHGDEEVGDHTIALGFQTEPAFAGQPNAVEVAVTRGGEPVADIAAGDLTVDVSLGDQQTTFELAPSIEPGVSTAPFIPSEPGAYTFYVYGDIDGEPVDIEMTAGPDTFSEVLDPAEASFPATSGPSGDDLTAAVAASTQRADDAKAAADRAGAALAAADDSASTAMTVAIVALVLGALGVGVGGLALVRARARS